MSIEENKVIATIVDSIGIDKAGGVTDEMHFPKVPPLKTFACNGMAPSFMQLPAFPVEELPLSNLVIWVFDKQLRVTATENIYNMPSSGIKT